MRGYPMPTKKNLQKDRPIRPVQQVQGKQAQGGGKLPLILLPIFLFTILLVLTAINLLIEENIDRYKLVSSPYSFSLSKYPILENNALPFISANGAVIIDAESKKILYEKNRDLRFSPASTTKIMTALTALEYFKLNDLLTVPQDSTIDSVINLRRGGEFRFIDLLYAMMLPSDNRSADAIAQNYPGGIHEFVKKMNENAKLWNLKNTYFADPAGLLDDLNYTTPLDLSILATIAMENETIRNIVSTKSTNISDSLSMQTYELENLNILLGSEGVIGLKTGHTDQAGDVLVTAKNYNEHLIIMTVLNSEDRFGDTLGLLDFIKDKINYLTIHP